MTVVGLHCCEGFFSSFSDWAFHFSGFSCCGTWTLGSQASIVAAPGLTGSVVVMHGFSSCTA